MWEERVRFLLPLTNRPSRNHGPFAAPCWTQLPAPCYSQASRRSAGSGYSTTTCILPHLGVQITPEVHSSSQEQAEQTAATCAILYLEGCIDIHSSHCRVVPVGFPPLLRPEQLREWEGRMQRQAQWLAQNKVGKGREELPG